MYEEQDFYALCSCYITKKLRALKSAFCFLDYRDFWFFSEISIGFIDK
jgi:hypothetical protein